MKFWKLAWRRMIRGKSTSILTLLVLILGSALFVDSNISLSFTVNRAFEDANESVFVDITVSLSLFDRISSTETQQLVDEIQSIRSIASAEPLALFSGIAFAPGDENSPYNVTITGISSETEYFSSALSLDWSSQSEGNKCYVSSSGSFLEYSETNRDLIVNFTLIGNDGPRIVSFDVDVESSVNLTLAQESITQGIFMSDADPRTRLEKNVIFIDYERIMEFAEIDEVPDRLVFGYDNSILISVDRSSFDILQIDLATSHMQTVENSIANLVKATSQNSVVQNHLGLTLVTIASWIGIQSIEAQSLIVSVVFVSCYLAFVSYRITHRRRRREFGRVRTKGFPQEYISRTDITESAILGITGGLLGYIVGIGLASLGFMIQNLASLSQSFGLWFTPSTFTTLFLAVFISFSISVIASYLSIREMTNKSIVEQLRFSDATMHSKSTQWNTFVSLMIIPALIQIMYDISGYHVVVDAFFANSSGIASTIIFNAILMVISWLRVISPILLTYGIAIVLTKNQKVWSGISSKLGNLFSGDIGSISTKSAYFDAKRTSSLVFILSFFIVLSVVNPFVALSQYDHDSRAIKARIGSDINLVLSDNTDLIQTLGFLDTVEGIDFLSVLHTSRMYLGYSEINIVIINRSSWVDSAYIEENWFKNLSPLEAMVQLDTNSCLGETDLLLSLNSEVGDVLPLSINPAELSTMNLTINGALRVEPYTHDPTIIGSIMISIDTFKYLRDNVDYTTRILLRLETSANASGIMDQLQASDMFSILESAEVEIDALISNPFYGGLLQIRMHSIIFAYMLSFIGMILISSTYANEMKHDISVYYLRGFSRKQRTRTAYTSFVVYLALSFVVGIAIGIPVLLATIGIMNSATLNIVAFNLVLSVTPFLWLFLEVIGMLVSTYLIFWYLSSGKVK